MQTSIHPTPTDWFLNRDPQEREAELIKIRQERLLREQRENAERIMQGLPSGLQAVRADPNVRDVNFPGYENLTMSELVRFPFRNNQGGRSAAVIVATNYRPGTFGIDHKGNLVPIPSNDPLKLQSPAFYGIIRELSPEGKMGKLDRSQHRNGLAFLLSDIDKVADACCHLAKVPTRDQEKAMREKLERRGEAMRQHPKPQKKKPDHAARFIRTALAMTM